MGRGCLRESLTSSKLAVWGKEEQDGKVDLRVEHYRESSVRRGTYAHGWKREPSGGELYGVLCGRCELSMQ